MIVRAAEVRDADAFCRIYNPFVRSSIVTFEEAEVSSEEMAGRIAGIGSSHPWLVAEHADRVVGYAYANRFHERSAYRFAATSTVYVDETMHRQGIGKELYRQLMRALGERSIHTVIGLISLPNPPSVALHEAMGFVKVAHLAQVGFKFGRWIDVGYWQLILRGPR